jgi:hypothetical protein
MEEEQQQEQQPEEEEAEEQQQRGAGAGDSVFARLGGRSAALGAGNGDAAGGCRAADRACRRPPARPRASAPRRPAASAGPRP